MAQNLQLSAFSCQLSATKKEDRMKNQNIKPITKARNLESAKKGLSF